MITRFFHFNQWNESIIINEIVVSSAYESIMITLFVAILRDIYAH